MAQIESRKDVSCTELIGIAAMVAVEYRADQKRTGSKSKQAHLIGVPAHIVTIQQQIAEQNEHVVPLKPPDTPEPPNQLYDQIQENGIER